MAKSVSTATLRNLFPTKHQFGFRLFLVTAVILVLAAASAAQQPSSDKKSESENKTPSVIELQTQGDSTPDETANTEAADSTAPSSQSPSVENKSSSSTTVTVNGQNIPVPENGTVNTEVTSPDGTTSVHIESSQSQSQSSSSSSFRSTTNTSSNSTIIRERRSQ